MHYTFSYDGAYIVAELSSYKDRLRLLMSTYIQLGQTQVPKHCDGSSSFIENQTDVSCPSERGQVWGFSLACSKASVKREKQDLKRTMYSYEFTVQFATSKFVLQAIRSENNLPSLKMMLLFWERQSRWVRYFAHKCELRRGPCPHTHLLPLEVLLRGLWEEIMKVRWCNGFCTVNKLSLYNISVS